MKGLLIKDYYTLIKVMRLYIILMLAFSLNQSSNLMVFPLVYAAMLPVSAISYDERSKWNVMARMMPYKVTDIVLEKYVLGYIAMTFAAILMLAVRLVMSLVDFGTFGTEFVVTVLSVLFVGLSLLAILLPVMYRFGTEQGRIVFIIIFAVIMALTIAAGSLLGGVLDVAMVYSAVVIIGAVSVVLNVLSVLLSVKIYKSKAM